MGVQGAILNLTHPARHKMTTLNWIKAGIGYYETTNRQFRAFRHENGLWLLMQRNDETNGNWDWCQSYGLLRDAKTGAQEITNV